jgi:hypothetical protein
LIGRILAAGLCLALLAPSAHAKNLELAEVLPQDLEAKALVGKEWFGVFDRLGRSVGTLELEVGARAPQPGFTLRMRCVYAFRGAERVELVEELLLNAKLELEQARHTSKEGADPKTEFFVKVKQKVCTSKDAKGTWESKLSFSPLSGIAHKLFLGRLVLPNPDPARLSELGLRGDEVRTRWIRAQATKEQVVVRLGELASSSSTKVKGWRMVRRKGRVERVEPDGWEGISLQSAKDEAGAKSDRPVVPPGTARAAVLTFLVGVATGDVDAAAKVVDWGSLQKNTKGEGTPEQFKKRLLGRMLRASAELDLDHLERAAKDLAQTKLADGRLSVTFPGEGLAFVVAKSAAGWRIVDLK